MGAVGGGGAATGPAALERVAGLHPVFVEGRAGGDKRDAAEVAAVVVDNLRGRGLDERAVCVVSQGDPPAATGVAPVGRLVAEALGAARVVVLLDEDIDPSHAELANREGAEAEVRYSQLAAVLGPERMGALEAAVDGALAEKNARRASEGVEPLAGYYRTYALLQEVAKGGLTDVCAGRCTVAHTCEHNGPDTVTSFCEVGVRLGLYRADDVVPFGPERRG